MDQVVVLEADQVEASEVDLRGDSVVDLKEALAVSFLKLCAV